VVEANRELRRQKIPAKQVAFVHDEIQVEAKEEYAEQVTQIMIEAARKAGETLGFRCPVDAESKIGMNWYETH
jgi:DNA polymerase I-like protein with 3'-5' exonuclease and polymerase domains